MSTILGKLYALVGADTSDFTRKMTGVSALAKNVGKSLTLKLTLPLVLLGGAAVKTAADFEQSLTNAFSVTGSSSKKVRQDMEDLARSMGEKTVFSAGQAADAMYFMASAGWKADEMTVALKDTLDLAAATQSDLAFTTDTVVSTLNQFQLSADQAGRVSDVFAGAISNSQATMDKLKTSMSYVGPIAKALNYSLEDTTAALSMLYNKGIDASMAGTGLRMSLAKLMKPSQDTAAGIKALGLTMEDVNPETKSLAEIVGVLEDKSLTAGDAIKIFGVRAGPTMLNLVAAGREELESFSETLGESGTAAEMAEKQVNTLQGQWKLFTSALSEAAIQVGQILIPILKDIINKGLKPMIQWFSGLSEGTKKVILVVAAFAAALGPMLLIIGKIASILPLLSAGTAAWGVALKVALGPLGLITAAAIVAYKVIKDLTKAKSDMVDADYRAFEAQKKLGQKLREAADAVGMTRREFVKLEQAYDGNTAALANAIRKGKHGVELQESLAEVGKKHREEIEKLKGAQEDAIGPGKAFRDINAEIKAAIEAATLAEKAAETAAKEWAATMEGLGLKTIPQKEAAVKDLQGTLDKLHQMYKAGLLDMDDYLKAVETVEEKIEGLSTTLVETAIPAARDFGEEVKDAMDGAISETEEFTGAVEEETTKIEDRWGEMWDNIEGQSASIFSDIITGAVSLGDGLKGIWGTIKQGFADTLGDMLSEFTTKFLKGILSGVTDSISGLGNTIGSAIGGLFGGGGGEGGGGGGIGGLIGGAGGASPWGMLAQGVGGMLGGLLTGGKDTHYLKGIKENTWEAKMDLRNIVNNQDFLKEKADWSFGQLETMNAQLNSIKLNGWTMAANLDSIKKAAWKRNTVLRTKLKTLIELMGGDGGAGGETPAVTTPGLTGGGPDIPSSDTAAGGAGAAAGGTYNERNVFNLDLSAFDSSGLEALIENKIFPGIMRILETRGGKRERAREALRII